MQKYSLVIIFNPDKSKVLMIHRSKNPYKGLYNFVGGKIEEGETYLQSAYREMFEETGIDKSKIDLIPFMDFKWHFINMEMKVFIGRLLSEVELVEEIHSLHWISVTENFFDMTRFAGEGNIGHMIELYFQNQGII